MHSEPFNSRRLTRTYTSEEEVLCAYNTSGFAKGSTSKTHFEILKSRVHFKFSNRIKKIQLLHSIRSLQIKCILRAIRMQLH